jgi:S1-C subfamily serine protease
MYSAVVKLHTQHLIYDSYVPFQIIATPMSTGTAFFIEQGLLLTCFHCTEHNIKIFISDPAISKKQFSVSVIAVIQQLDIALLKLDNTLEHASLSLGDSDMVKPLDQVEVLGYPLDSNSLKYTKGIISGKQHELLQTDASLNPGNSGGPLLFKDRVIGINSSKFTNAENTGFSVPINFFKKWKEYIMTAEKPVVIKLPVLNITYSRLNECAIEYLNKKNKDPVDTAVVITKSKNSFLKRNDLIIKINDDKVDNYGNIDWKNNKVSISKYLINFIVNEEINITLIRNGRKLTLPYTIKNEVITGTSNLALPFEQYNYLVIGGIVIMEVTHNHLDTLKDIQMNDFHKMQINTAIENKLEKTFFISRILTGSKIKSLENIYDGIIIRNINKVHLTSFDDVLTAIKNPYNGFLILYLQNDSIFMYPYSELIKIDEELTKTYNYNITYMSTS